MITKIKGVLSWLGSRSLKVKIGLIGVLALLIAGGWYLNAQRTSAPQYQTATVTKGTIITTVSESGSVIGGQVSVNSTGDGIVSAVFVKNGDKVTQGQNLFKVTSSATPQQKASAYASYLSAQSALNSAQAQKLTLQNQMFAAWDKQYTLATNGTYSNPDGSPNVTNRALPEFQEANAAWLAAEASYKNQDIVVAQEQAALSNAWYAYNATQDPIVTAPIAGTVSNLAITTGSMVSAGSASNNSSSTTSTATTAMMIGDPSSIQVKVQASEVDVPQIMPGQVATVTLDALPNQTFIGKVANVDSVGTTTSGVVTYNVYISLLSPSDKILSGMTASAIIQTNKKDDVLTVPSSAIQSVSGQSTVRVMQNGKITSVPVETGLVGDTDTEITSGLTEGQTIVTSVTTRTGATGSTGASPFSSLGGNRGFGGGGAVIRGGGARGG